MSFRVLPVLVQKLWRYGFGALGSLWHQGSDGIEVEVPIGAAGKRLRSTGTVPEWSYPKVATKTTGYTAAAGDEYLLCDATSAGFTVALPAATSCVGMELIIVKIDASANLVTVDPNSGELINGAATHDLEAQYDAICIVSDGTGWYIAPAGGTSVGGGGDPGETFTYFDPEKPEDTPNAADDDYNAADAKWTTVGAGGSSVIDTGTSAPGGFYVYVPGGESVSSRGKVQACIPTAGVDFTVVLGPVRVSGPYGDFAYQGLMLSTTATGGAGSQKYNAIVSAGGGDGPLRWYVQNFANYAFSSGGEADDIKWHARELWFRFRRVGTTYYASISRDGTSWRAMEVSFTLGWTPTHVGPMTYNASNKELEASFGCFRLKTGNGNYQFGGFRTVGEIGPTGPEGPPGGALADGDYGDVTVSGIGTVFTLDNGVVTPAKCSNGMRDYTVPFIVDGGGSALTTGLKGGFEIPADGTIVAVRVFALDGLTGSIVFDLWKDTYANFPPTIADTITASAKPTISAAIKAQDTTLTGWTTSVVAGNIIFVNIDSISTFTRVLLSITIRRS